MVVVCCCCCCFPRGFGVVLLENAVIIIDYRPLNFPTSAKMPTVQKLSFPLYNYVSKYVHLNF